MGGVSLLRLPRSKRRLYPPLPPSAQNKKASHPLFLFSQREAVAVAFVKKGKGLIKVNGVPIELVQPESLRFKVWEPVLLLGANRYREVDIRIRVKGGGYTSQLYAIRQAIGKALVAWYQKNVDEASKREIKEILMNYDRTLLVADPRRPEPKKFGGRGARARFQKSYR